MVVTKVTIWCNFWNCSYNQCTIPNVSAQNIPRFRDSPYLKLSRFKYTGCMTVQKNLMFYWLVPQHKKTCKKFPHFVYLWQAFFHYILYSILVKSMFMETQIPLEKTKYLIQNPSFTIQNTFAFNFKGIEIVCLLFSINILLSFTWKLKLKNKILVSVCKGEIFLFKLWHEREKSNLQTFT